MTAPPFMASLRAPRRPVNVRSVHRMLRSGSVCVGLCLTVSIARARDDDAPQTCLTFRADQVVLDPARESVVLEGGVDAQCGAYRLRGQRVELRGDSDQVCVHGPASLLLCPCDRAPLSIDFDHADLSASGDLTLQDPSLRIGESRVFWLPWLWLRAPDRVGALPPKLAWRGDGGLLAGPGVRVPWTTADGSISWFDLYVSGYTRGGFEVEPAIITPSSSTTVRFDRMDGDLLRLRSQGVVPNLRQGGLAWRADMSRGPRARSGLVELRDAAVAFDHASGFVDVRPWRSASVRSGMVVVGARGGDTLAFGPALFADAGGSLGTGTAWETGGGFRMLDQTDGAAQLASARARLVSGRWWGPLRLSLDVQSTAWGASEAGQSNSELAAWVTREVGLPLSRRFGGSTHVLEPFVRGMVFGAMGDGEATTTYRPRVLADGIRWSAMGGVKSALGPVGGEQAGRIELAAGRLGGIDYGTADAVVGRLELRTGALALEGEAAGVFEGSEKGGMVVARARAGDSDTVGASAEVASRSRLDTLDARAFQPSGATWAPVGALSQPGTSLFLEGHVPLGGGLRWGANGDWDVGQERRLAAGSGLVLEHPCGCLQGRAWVSRRIGRPGTDGWVTVELR